MVSCCLIFQHFKFLTAAYFLKVHRPTELRAVRLFPKDFLLELYD